MLSGSNPGNYFYSRVWDGGLSVTHIDGYKPQDHGALPLSLIIYLKIRMNRTYILYLHGDAMIGPLVPCR